MNDSAPEPGSTSGAPSAPQSAGPGPRTARITVVDDNQEFLDLLRDLFGEFFEVSTVARVASVNDVADTAPDILIVDLHSSETTGRLTGPQLVGLARRHRSLRRVPIIVCTGDVTGIMRRGDDLIAHGNVHLLAKPFELEVIEGLVNRLVSPDHATDQAPSASD
jgi:CheY-like chemotaxis protein